MPQCSCKLRRKCVARASLVRNFGHDDVPSDWVNVLSTDINQKINVSLSISTDDPPPAPVVVSGPAPSAAEQSFSSLKAGVQAAREQVDGKKVIVEKLGKIWTVVEKVQAIAEAFSDVRCCTFRGDSILIDIHVQIHPAIGIVESVLGSFIEVPWFTPLSLCFHLCWLRLLGLRKSRDLSYRGSWLGKADRQFPADWGPHRGTGSQEGITQRGPADVVPNQWHLELHPHTHTYQSRRCARRAKISFISSCWHPIRWLIRKRVQRKNRRIREGVH